MPTSETKLNGANDLGLKVGQQALFHGYRAKICERAGVMGSDSRMLKGAYGLESAQDSLASIDS